MVISLFLSVSERWLESCQRFSTNTVHTQFQGFTARFRNLKVIAQKVSLLYPPWVLKLQERLMHLHRDVHTSTAVETVHKVSRCRDFPDVWLVSGSPPVVQPAPSPEMSRSLRWAGDRTFRRGSLMLGWQSGSQSRADRILPCITNVASCMNARIWTRTFFHSWFFLLLIARHLKQNDCHMLSSILVLCSISLDKYNGLLDNFNNFSIYWIFAVLRFKLMLAGSYSTNGAIY